MLLYICNKSLLPFKEDSVLIGYEEETNAKVCRRTSAHINAQQFCSSTSAHVNAQQFSVSMGSGTLTLPEH